MPEPIVVWHFTDGKPGHDNQTAGLLAALRDRVSVDSHRLQTQSCRLSPVSFITRHIAFAQDLPDPDLIIGAGHATHLRMLAARRARGGRAIVLMKPTLPTGLFDLCIIPAHDGPPAKDNILVTRGVLNRVRNSPDKDAGAGLILVGGPSAHVDWSSEDIIRQIRSIVEHTPGVNWTLTTSRRTPADFMDMLTGFAAGQPAVVPAAETTSGWLPERLARASQVWVSEDSVSMVYEALTSGAAVGLLSVPWRKSADRLASGIRVLLRDGLVTGFDGWQESAELRRPAESFDEAGRCADWILERWPVNS
ncbi:MAG: hypothetical protein HKP57_06655 [Halobacteria archaeon]|nr:hypothetical protein [Halobacteria archaeon]